MLGKTSPTVSLLGDGVNTVFGFSFKVWKADEVKVFVKAPDAATAEVTDFSVIVNSGTGGSVTYPTAGDPLPAGHKITILRHLDYTQERDFANNNAVLNEEFEGAVDKATALVQQVEEQVGRAVSVPPGESSEDYLTQLETLKADTLTAKQGAVASAVTAGEEASAAAGSASAAQGSAGAAQTARQASEDARDATITTRDEAIPQITTAKDNAITAVQNEGTAQVGAVNSAGDAQEARVESMGDDKVSEINTAHTAAANDITAKHTTAANDITTKHTAAVDDIATERTAATVDIAAKHSTAVTEITDTRDAATVLVDTHKTQGVSSVDAAKQQAVDTIKAMPEYLPNFEATLQDQIAKAISGQLAGTEGKWKFVKSVPLTPTGKNTDSTLGTTSSNIFTQSVPNETIHVGSWIKVLEDEIGLIAGDSGVFYEVAALNGSNAGLGRTMVLSPKHGYVNDDFTVGKTYHILIFKESTVPEDQQVGTRNVVEYFLGGATATWDAFPNTPYYDFTSKKTVQFNTELAPSRTSIPVSVTVHQVYDPVNPVITLSTNRYLQYMWEACFSDVDMVYDAGNHTLTWAGTLTRSISFDEIGFTIRMDSGKILSRGESYSMMDILLSGGSPAYAVYFDSANRGVDNVEGEWQLRKITADLYNNPAGVPFNIEDVISVGSYGTLNVGYWDGKVWKSQLLGDAEKSDGRAVVKLTNKFTATSTVEVRKADGTWQLFNFGDSRSALGWSRHGDHNTIYVNTASSYATLGYASEADMLANSAVRVEYQTAARVWRPVASAPAAIAVSDEVHLVGMQNYGGKLCSDLIGYVPVGGQTWIRTVKVLRSDYQYWGSSRRLEQSVYSDSTHPSTEDHSACAVRFLLSEMNGTIHLVCHFKELVYAANWGDDLALMSKDNVITTADDNGNVVLTGCMGYDTGIPA